MIELHGPYQKRKRFDDLYHTVIFLLFLAVLALGCFAFLRACVQYRHDYDWVSKKERVSMMRYHGTQALRITEDTVFIWRGGKWIPVKKKESP